MTSFIIIAFFCLLGLLLSLIFDFDDHSAQSDHQTLGGFFSLQALMMFGVGFGAVGAISLSYGLGLTWAMLWGSLFGGFMGFTGAKLTTALQQNQTDSTPMLGNMIGYAGRVITSINPPELGEVTVLFHGQNRTFRASSDSRIPSGSSVKVQAVNGLDVHVRPLGGN